MQPRHQTPLMTPRRLLTLGLLLSSLVIVLLAQASFKRPGMWRWATPNYTPDNLSATSHSPEFEGQPNATNSSTHAPPTADFLGAMALFELGSLTPCTPGASLGVAFGSGASEFVPLPSGQAAKPRQAPYPDLRLLKGAADGEPFLVPASDSLPELQASAKARQDAQARYHLLSLAHAAQPGALQADGRSDLRYQALRFKPKQFRGDLVAISGTLISLGEPMELHQRISGLEYCYLGLIATDIPKQSYLVLFTQLPESLMTLRAQWGQLYVHDVKFTGYFYKTAKFSDPSKREPWLMPVLIGKTLQMPATVQAADPWWSYFLVFGLMALPALVVVLLIPRFFRRREWQQQAMLDRFRQRSRQTLSEPPYPSEN